MVDGGGGQTSDADLPVLRVFLAVMLIEGFLLLSFLVWL